MILPSKQPELLEAMKKLTSTSKTPEEFLQDSLQVLCDASGAHAGMYWKSLPTRFECSASTGIVLAHVNPASHLLHDILGNADAVISNGSPEIFVSEAPETPAKDDEVLHGLVQDHRQLIFSIRSSSRLPLGVFVLFQSKTLPDQSKWDHSDLGAAQQIVEKCLRQIQPLQDSATEAKVPAKPRTKAPQPLVKDPAPAQAVPSSSIEIRQARNSDAEKHHQQAATPIATATKSFPEERVAKSTLDVPPTALGESPQAKPTANHLASKPLEASETRPSPPRASRKSPPKTRGKTAARNPKSVSEQPDRRNQNEAPNQLQSRASQLTQVVGRSLDEKECAFDVVNEMQTLLGEGRVSLATKRGNVCRIQAISHQSVFDPRSAVVMDLETLATKVARIGQPIWHPDDEEQISTGLREAFTSYYESTDTKSIALLPLIKRSEPSTDPKDLSAVVLDRHAKPGQTVGVIMIEGIQAALSEADVLPAWSLVETPIVNAVTNAHNHSSLFLMPVWRSIGRFINLFRGHTCNKALAISAIVIACLLALVMVPTDFRLRCEGVVQPVNRSKVFAEAEGVVEELLVKDGQFVKQGDVLMTLSNPMLAAELADVEGELRQIEEQLRTCKLMRMRGGFSSEEERKQNVMDCAAYAARMEKLSERFDLLREKQQQLTITSPVSGQVITWDTQRRLQSRPVTPGQKLLTVADPEGPWELELRLPDKRSGYLRRIWNDEMAASDAENRPEASYVFASSPGTVASGTVRHVAHSADVDEEFGNIVRVYVDLEENPGGQLGVRPGTEVIAHIHAGETSLGYGKMYEFFDWVRRTWFKYM